MDFFLLVFIAIALAMDAFAVSISSGIIIKDVKLKHALKIASSTGFFQGFFTLLGWLGGIIIAFVFCVKSFNNSCFNINNQNFYAPKIYFKLHESLTLHSEIKCDFKYEEGRYLFHVCLRNGRKN